MNPELTAYYDEMHRLHQVWEQTVADRRSAQHGVIYRLSTVDPDSLPTRVREALEKARQADTAVEAASRACAEHAKTKPTVTS